MVCLIGPPAAEADAQAVGARAALIWGQMNTKQLTEVANLADTGRFRAEIAAVFALKDAAQAHTLSQTERVRGKIVLQVI
jgi:NADPH:quinone reductase-like Zn-dependent oxidoreductase